jgi:uncharacterized DUF497 family protein
MIDISFDARKDAYNRRKHGISLRRAEAFDMDTAWIELDDSQDDGEARYVGVGWIQDQLYTMTFTLEDERFRIINLRKASATEHEIYAENT